MYAFFVLSNFCDNLNTDCYKNATSLASVFGRPAFSAAGLMVFNLLPDSLLWLIVYCQYFQMWFKGSTLQWIHTHVLIM